MAGQTLVRQATSSDWKSIFEVVAQAFEREGEARLVELIRERDEALCELVAVEDEVVVGHVIASPISLEASGRFAGVAPLSVLPMRQGAGIGGLLMRALETELRAAGFDALFLLGNPDYYSRFGYVSSHVGNDYGATGAFQHLELTVGVLKGISDTAHYVNAFEEVGA